ncbi:hypothetical protein F5144DRAFT_64788 [Chaetomium tenue]|uniref:Uncharacterized protein n=1 Tax=Chaetomium tenue TaxID=1854479 RepID=A0ACB7PT04_9PEZI|nr:hypothetical protein F5144DRAFT_64788 [Chaetomium globosum]
MCLIGLLLPLKPKKQTRTHRSKGSSHRHSSHGHSSHRRSERPHRERSHRREKEEPRNSAAVAEEALTRLCLSLEQSLLDEQQRWREQDRLDMSERRRLGLERDRTPFEEAPPYSVRDTMRQPTPEPQYQNGIADSPRSRERESDSTGSIHCCRNCVCARCGHGSVKCPTMAELDDTTRVRAFMNDGADSWRRRD